MRNDVFSLLNVNQTLLSEFPLQAVLVDDLQTQKNIAKNIKRLNQIEDAVSSGEYINVNSSLIKETLHKAKGAVVQENQVVQWSFSELRILSYRLLELESDDRTFQYVLDLLEKDWLDLYLNGLVFYVLKGWTELNPEHRRDVCNMIRLHLGNYQGGFTRYVHFKECIDLFDENGPLRLSVLLNQRSYSIFDAPSLLGLRSQAITYAYFSDVIIDFVKQNYIEDITSLYELFQKHHLTRTKKLLLAHLVKEADEMGSERRQTAVGRLAANILGNIGLNSTWAPFKGATLEEIGQLKTAKELVNKWYARKVVNVFFEICVEDPMRKAFWLQYVDYVSDFKIAGSSAIRQYLNSDSRVGNMLHDYFIETNSKAQKTTALILKIKDKIFVEFSDTGALYIYDKGNKIVKNILFLKNIGSISELKNPYMVQAITQDNGYYYFCKEGNMRHSGFWQSRLQAWFDKIMQLKPNYIGSKEDIQINSHNSKIIELPKHEEPTSIAAGQYIDHIEIKLNSKWVFGNVCRIVADLNGYYLEVSSLNGFFYLKPLVSNDLQGSIWLKKHDSNQLEVVHVDNTQEITIGYLKELCGFIFFRESLHDTTSIKVKL